MENQTVDSTGSLLTIHAIKIGDIYQHYSGKMYKVIALAHDSEDPSLMRVIYQALYDCPTFGSNSVWARTYTMFTETIVMNGKKQDRFEKIYEKPNNE